MNRYDAKTLAAATGLVISLLCASVSDVYGHYDNITQNVLRLHIPANSDSDEDQAVKLAVRDELISRSEDIFADCTTREEVLAAAEDNLDEFELIADEVLSENGFDYTASAELAEMHFDKRVYGDLTVPEGDYTALRITLGSGEGHNWWCVMYPPLCLPCFADRSEDEVFDECGDYISEEEADMLKQPEKIEAKLYIAELVERIAAYFRGLGE
ncbi:MAG: stage II sporulation protein R [Oscillospiraceae bacterium]|nr:stage II sporulation protein R [Oscillospiraceae bacterium]